ncbi:hypothetical protein GDO86_018362 [Hymenochirus boettgeri]|uniref:NECAP PHear domain-containing protein n=1 Tax=Hymenochirus boettgeri TaxID=247094 RepID=A0A8T2IK91_9PIPI|nr:hypothetical protein GDO86_018362 [Hymenochirus boettgeri]
MADSDYESVLCVKPEVHVYRIPPRTSNRGYRAADWKLDQPDWSGRLRITNRGKMVYIKLEDRTSGELFAQAPVEQFPGIAVESVIDSSRYFVICVEDGNGRRAFIGVGFADRGDAFDFNVALQDHFKWGPKLDLGFKEGQTIKINIANMKKKESPAAIPKPRPLSGTCSLLPPPPGAKAPAPSAVPVQASLAQPAATADVLLDLGDSSSWTGQSASSDTWGDFTKAPGAAPGQASTGWVQF